MLEARSYGRVPGRALVLSLGALAVPVVTTLLYGTEVPEQQPLLWLLALVPAFLFAYYRGWRGATMAIAGGMVAVVLAHGVALWRGHILGATPLTLLMVLVFVVVSLAIGWTTELLHRRLLAAQEGLTEFTMVVSEGTIIRYVTPSVRHVLGFSPAELEGSRLDRILDPVSAAQLAGRLATLREGEALHLQLQRRDGEARLMDVLAQDRRGQPSVRGYVLRARDVTDRRTAEEQERRTARMQAIGSLAGPLAHDFNNALTSIRGNADLLREDLANRPDALALLSDLTNAAERAGRTVDMLLAFARQQVLRPRALALPQVLEEIRPRLAELLGSAVQVEVSSAEDVPLAYFDPVQLRQLLLLLGVRGREVMPAGGRFVVHAAAGEVSDAEAASFPYPVTAGEYAVLNVRDSGTPLTGEQLANAFEPFAASLGSAATGLELSSVYGTVKQGGGYVWADSGREGTCIRIYLPVAATPLPLLPAHAAQATGTTVLVVEDDRAVRAVVRQVLMREGYSVIEAEDGEEALALVAARGRPPDALVTDLLMPRLGGRQLARKLTSRYGAFPILYMSGFTPEAVMAESLLKPGETLLSKPFSADSLTETLQAVLEGVEHT